MGLTGAEVAQRIGARSEAIARILETEDGRLMLEAIESEFHPSRLLGADDRTMHFNLGAFAVAAFLRELRDAALRRKGAANGRG